MKKLLFALLLLTTTTFAQNNPALRLSTDSTMTDINGGTIDKGDEFYVYVQLDGNGNTTSRSLYFDFQFQNTAFELVTVEHTGTGGNGGVLPQGSTITLDWYQYPGYTWNSTQDNTTTNGNTNYSNQSYSYTNGGANTIVRVYLNWASSSGLPYDSYDNLLKLKFRLKSNATGNSWDPIKMNFAASYNQDGTTGSTLMEIPLTTVITENPNAIRYVKVHVDLDNNIDLTYAKLLVVNSATNMGEVFDIPTTGDVYLDTTRVDPSTEYRISVAYNMDYIEALYDAGVTISDYMIAQTEFVQQNLDGTFNSQNIMTGIGYKAADINRNDKLDGGDLSKLFSQVVGVDNFINLPSQYEAGSGGLMTLMTFDAIPYNAVQPNDWASVFPAGPQYVTYTTAAAPGTLDNIEIKYLLTGDINKSHSSPVVRNGEIATNYYINNRNPSLKNINVNLSNVTVTSNSIEIPVNVNTNGQNVSGLQFEFRYDPNKIKFDELINEMPNTWYVFANKKEGVIKFGALDENKKTFVNGNITPFKLKFSTLQNGLDINSYISVTSTMDAASSSGHQLGINLNTTKIKLTGYNNF